MNRHDDSPGPAFVMEHDVASTPSHFTPTHLAEGAQCCVARDSGESRHPRQTLTLWRHLISILVFGGPLLGDPDRFRGAAKRGRALPSDERSQRPSPTSPAPLQSVRPGRMPATPESTVSPGPTADDEFADRQRQR